MQIKEFKCTCHACGNTWFLGYDEVLIADASAKANAGKALLCCAGCLPALAIPSIKSVDVDKCPKCGSRAIKRQEITHEV